MPSKPYTNINTTMQSRNRLSHVASGRLYNFLNKAPERTRTTNSKILAQEATKELGFEVNARQVNRFRIEMGLSERKKPKLSDDRIEILARELIKLSKDLNIPLSEPFRRTFSAYL